MNENQQVVSDEDIEEVTKLLRHLNRPSVLNETRWINSCLVSEYRREKPDVLPYQALREILKSVLAVVKSESEMYSNILTSVFWDDNGVTEISRKAVERWGLAESTFWLYYRDARKEFTHFLLQKERMCSQNCSEVVEGVGKNEQAETGATERERVVLSKREKGLLRSNALSVEQDLEIIEARQAGGRSVPTLRYRYLVLSILLIVVISIWGTFNFVSGITPTATHPSRNTHLPSTTTPLPSIRESYVCSGLEPKSVSWVPFLRSQGVTAFTVENTVGAVLNNRVRALAMDERGLWIGYFPSDDISIGGVGFYDGQVWVDCNRPSRAVGMKVNAVVVDLVGQVWVGTEKSGIMMFDREKWRTFTTRDGLPDNGIFGLTVDRKGGVWAATWAGIAKFDGGIWETPYTIYNNTLFNNHTHAIAFSRGGDIWVGHMRNAGVSHYSNSDGQWHHLTVGTSGIGGNEIRDIIVRESKNNIPESIWFATEDGGISRLEEGTWTVFRTEDGLPSNRVNAIAIDKYGRIWAATDKGVAYLEGSNWIVYDTINTLSIALAPGCGDCPFEDGEHIWTGTNGFGLTHSRLPFLNNDTVVQVQEVCFVPVAERERSCVTVEQGSSPYSVRALHPQVVVPGEQFRVEIFISPRSPYQLKPGDFLSNTSEGDEVLFGVWPHMAVDKTVESGEPFLFTDYDNPITIPQLPSGENIGERTTTWRVWMHTRYVGPYIQIAFDVQNPTNESEGVEK